MSPIRLAQRKVTSPFTDPLSSQVPTYLSPVIARTLMESGIVAIW